MPLMVLEPLIHSTTPLMNVPVPSVTISDGMRKYRMNAAFTTPTATPDSIATAIAALSDQPIAHSARR